MPILSNSIDATPVQLRLERRKSFSFSVSVRTADLRALDLTNCKLSLVVQRSKYPYDNVISAEPLVREDKEGYARFDLQATDLDIPVGEYPYVVTLVTPAGYSQVIIKGHLDVQDNPDFSATDFVYNAAAPALGIEAVFRSKNHVTSTVGVILPPGCSYITDEERQMINDVNIAVQEIKARLKL